MGMAITTSPSSPMEKSTHIGTTYRGMNPSLLTDKETGKQEQYHIAHVIIQPSLHKAVLKSDTVKLINCHISRFLPLICDTLTGSPVPFNEDRPNLAVHKLSRRILIVERYYWFNLR